MSEGEAIIAVRDLGFPWVTQDPFLFCVYHSDAFPRGNAHLGPDASLEGRTLGNDFTIKDGWRMYHGTRVPGFPVHPHRGFETVTLVRKGLIDHTDSLGGKGRFGHGDVQWMTAGKGVQHAEMFPLINQEDDNPLELFQIWLNLPSEKKKVEAYYTMFWRDRIPHPVHEDPSGKKTRIEVVAGTYGDQQPPAPAPDSWASVPENQVAIWYFEMEPGASWDLPPASPGVNRSLYFFEGDTVSVAGKKMERHCAMELRPDTPVSLENGQAPSRFLLLQGKPIGEHVESYGPFVMNTKSEIEETYKEYRETRFGGWPWESDDPVHGREAARFARYPDGTEDFPDPLV